MANDIARRSLLAGAGAFTILRPEVVRGQVKDKLRAGLVGCGGRGTQAIVDTLTGNPNVEIVAMADIFEDKLEGSLRRLKETERYKAVADRVNVGPESRFVGFDAFKKLVKSDIDIVMLATPPGYRPEHFEAAVEAKKHIFCEKPIATDPVGVRRFMAAAKKAAELKLSVVSGAQRHSDQGYIRVIEKIRSGGIGDVVSLHSRYLSGPVMHARERNAKWGDMEWEHRNWYSFNWICGDQIVEQHYHNIDFMNWVMATHPVKVVASGGAAWRPRTELYGNIYDHLSSDFVYPNGVHLASTCRQYPRGCAYAVDDLVVGSKDRLDLTNAYLKPLREGSLNPYVQEHIDLVNSILGKGPYQNQAMAIAEATMTCIMARESAYSGLEVTWDMIMNSQLDLQPKQFGYDVKMDPPPLPVPGQYKFI